MVLWCTIRNTTQQAWSINSNFNFGKPLDICFAHRSYVHRDVSHFHSILCASVQIYLCELIIVVPVGVEREGMTTIMKIKLNWIYEFLFLSCLGLTLYMTSKQVSIFFSRCWILEFVLVWQMPSVKCKRFK